MVTDFHSIAYTLKQLIFRNNQQEFRNIKYKKREQMLADSRSRVGDTSTEPIDLDDDNELPHKSSKHSNK